MDVLDQADVAARLRAVGIAITLQRLALASLLFRQPVHTTAERLLRQVKQSVPETSRATVYNALKLFVEKGLIKELLVDPERVVFDSNTAPHHHLYDVDSGELTDVSPDDMQVVGLPELPAGTELQQVDVIVRIHSKHRA